MGDRAEHLPPYTLYVDYYSENIAPYLFDMWEAAFRLLVLPRITRARACADVACGPGMAAAFLTDLFDAVMGVDISLAMLRRARENTVSEKAAFLRQDMRFLALPFRVDFINCWGDSINHLLREEDLLWAFRSFSKNLNEGGLLFFDLNLERQLKDGAGDEWYEMESNGGRANWRLTWRDDDKTAFLEILFYDRQGQEIGREIIREKAHSESTVSDLLNRAGFKPLAWVDAATLGVPEQDSRRLAVLAVKT